jgi:hypothetical protein
VIRRIGPRMSGSLLRSGIWESYGETVGTVHAGPVPVEENRGHVRANVDSKGRS